MASQFQTLCGAVALMLVAGAAASKDEYRRLAQVDLTDLSATCYDRITDESGAVNDNKNSFCVACSQCADYESGWCNDNCEDLGDRTLVDDRDKLSIKAGYRNKCFNANTNIHIPDSCIKPEYKRRLSSAQVDLSDLSATCYDRITDESGAVNDNKNSLCVACSQCADYESGWCNDHCEDLGDRTLVDDRDKLS